MVAVISPMAEGAHTAQEKALKINLDAARYGTFAEIGAGQEVARWFFHVGKASSTVAKSISAYDKGVSDALYGTTPYFVSRARLEAMLDREYGQLVEQLDSTSGDGNRIFRICRYRRHARLFPFVRGAWMAGCSVSGQTRRGAFRSPDSH